MSNYLDKRDKERLMGIYSSRRKKANLGVVAGLAGVVLGLVLVLGGAFMKSKPISYALLGSGGAGMVAGAVYSGRKLEQSQDYDGRIRDLGLG